GGGDGREVVTTTPPPSNLKFALSSRPAEGRCSVEGMESVIATVSGYHGRERFNLIKLITQTGAHYVGAMGRSTTHLVCWELKGNKYSLAKSFGMKIVSHRWFEDCLKQGRRIPEGPYIMQSGKQVGALSWEVPDEDDCSKRKWEMPVEHNHGKRKWQSSREKRDVLADRSNIVDDARGPALGEVGNLYASSLVIHCISYVRSIFVEQPGCTSISLPASGRKRNLSDTYERSRTTEHRDRRLRKKGSIFEYLTNDVSDSSQGNQPTEVLGQQENSDSAYSNNLSNPERLDYSSVDNADSRSRRVEEFEDIVELSSYALSNGRASQMAFSSEGRKEMDAMPLIEDSLTSPELSCVICWTEFSSTRGILACGHRFCFTCIQEWAKCTASKGKVSTCPLCKNSFTSVTKVEGAASSDQKIYSQTVPPSVSVVDVCGLPIDQDHRLGPQPLESVCRQCHNSEPEDLLLCCHLCRSQWNLTPD
ncbi:hypothetical protein Taro_044310, partial [Colocasia esculenta]|nr:hypothetical protein [Colocasia esculenta]